MADKKDQFYTPPPKLTGWESFKLFLWNGETSEVLGRTGASWGKILVFYVVFYAALAGFFAGLLAIFWQTLDLNRPKWQLSESIIGTNPGLGFRPMPPEAHLGSTLVWYKASRPDNMRFWFETVNKFLDEYRDPTTQDNIDHGCRFDHPAQDGKFCQFKVDSLDNCSPGKTDGKFGFPQKKPCIFLKLNKIFNWVPNVFNETNEDEVRDDAERSQYRKMPQFLKDAIANTNREERNMVWVSCEGESPADMENLGPVNYSPRRGFPAYYFPYTNVRGYQPPIVAVQFERPKPGVLINVECKAWAKNIMYDRSERRGSVHFELMID